MPIPPSSVTHASLDASEAHRDKSFFEQQCSLRTDTKKSDWRTIEVATSRSSPGEEPYICRTEVVTGSAKLGMIELPARNRQSTRRQALFPLDRIGFTKTNRAKAS
jgi:hypothetical protein